MPSFHSNLSPDISVLSWKIVRYGHPPVLHSAHSAYVFQQTEVDGRAMELLAPRIKVLSESLHAPIHQGDVNEQERGKKLKQ